MKILILSLLLLTGCATAPTVLTEFETVTVEVPVRVPVPAELTEQPAACFFPSTGKLYIFDLDEWIACAVGNLTYYREALDRIRALQTEDPEP